MLEISEPYIAQMVSAQLGLLFLRLKLYACANNSWYFQVSENKYFKKRLFINLSTFNSRYEKPSSLENSYFRIIRRN